MKRMVHIILLLTFNLVAIGENGKLEFLGDGQQAQLRIIGSANQDWWIEHSLNLTEWSIWHEVSPLLSGNITNAPIREIVIESPMRFFRARATMGLYDTNVLRIFHFTFTQANWSNLLAAARNTTNWVDCASLTLNNGLVISNIGVRFRGNTSYTGGPSGVPLKKSIAVSIDYPEGGRTLMGYDSLNLNNAYGDETMIRESIYFNIMRNYTPCPKACPALVYINGEYRGLYSHVQQQDGTLIREYFPSNKGHRFRAGNMDANAAFIYLGTTNLQEYMKHYELKHTSATDTNIAWNDLVTAIYKFHQLTPDNIREEAEDILAVDRWLWFFALENIFVDEDSYWYKGSDYMLYYEPETGRVHPIEHDGNESLTPAAQINYNLSPLAGVDQRRPILYKLLTDEELKERYYAHIRTVLKEWFNPTNAIALIEHFHKLTVAAIAEDKYRGYSSMNTYSNELNALKTFIVNRYNYLIKHPDIAKPTAQILQVSYSPKIVGFHKAYIRAEVYAPTGYWVEKVRLYYRMLPYGKFNKIEMYDDGLHDDEEPGDGIFAGYLPAALPMTKVQFYIEAKLNNGTLEFSPPRAEEETYSYVVDYEWAEKSAVVINEFMAWNRNAIADPQGDYDDWVELYNLTGQDIDLSGCYLTDTLNGRPKWQFPSGTIIPANGYLIVWLDGDVDASEGLHASFGLAREGEQLYLIDKDENGNIILDGVAFGPQQCNISYGRFPDGIGEWIFMQPTPGSCNHR